MSAFISKHRTRAALYLALGVIVIAGIGIFRADDGQGMPNVRIVNLINQQEVPPPLEPPAEARFESDLFSTDLVLPESREPVHRVRLNVRLVDGGAGTVTFDSSRPVFNEFGDRVADGTPAGAVRLDCVLTLVRDEQERRLFEVRGPKIVSRLSLVAYPDVTPRGNGRLLISDHDGAVRYVIDLSHPEPGFPPCHPGCFPAGTLVRTPIGTRPIEQIRAGELINSLDVDGKTSPTTVTAVFKTHNRLLTVQMDGGALVTTETQPVALVAGGFRPAGELKVGEYIWRWVNGERKPADVLRVSPAVREAEVFNLVLGETTAFIAGDVVVRSKPPAVTPP